MSPGPRSTAEQLLLSGGSFLMGDAFGEGYERDGETPVHRVDLEPFHMDATSVTNAQFAAFVKSTGFVTDAEQAGFSAVFHLQVDQRSMPVSGYAPGTPWWLAIDGANWCNPEGPGSDVDQRQDHPVVHVSWHDANAYCAWAGKRLPTEAEWEYAARGGKSQKRYAWGDELTPGSQWECNIWQGVFPTQNTGDDGFLATAPVREFSPNGFGLWQTAGNVWEWCSDWFSSTYYLSSPSSNPRGPAAGAQRVMRGGSFLCHDSYCNRYRVAARSSNTPESSSSNMGFRCANDDEAG